MRLSLRCFKGHEHAVEHFLLMLERAAFVDFAEGGLKGVGLVENR
jgi:hypothetical protein